jgi:hypothetical protein
MNCNTGQSLPNHLFMLHVDLLVGALPYHCCVIRRWDDIHPNTGRLGTSSSIDMWCHEDRHSIGVVTFHNPTSGPFATSSYSHNRVVE